MTLQDTVDALKYCIEVTEFGTRRYYNSTGKRHRTDGPAVEWADGSKAWYFNGRLHRDGGPAIAWPDGSKFWYVDGNRHRTDGPAIEWGDGDKEWYINDVEYTEKQFNALVKK